MANKIEQTLPLAQLQAFLEELKALSAKPTLSQIQASAKRYGIDVSLMGARTFRKTTFADHLARLQRGREKTETILTALRGSGAHPLDAVEEAAAVDLLDAYTESEEVDTEKVIKAALNLRSSVSMRVGDARRAKELELKQAESEVRIRLAEQNRDLASRRAEKLEREKRDWERRQKEAEAALETVQKKGGITAETRAFIEKALKGEAA